MAGSTTSERRPLLPPVDGAERLREIAFAMILTEGRPVSVNELDRMAGGSATASAIDALVASGWLDQTDDGRIAGSRGLSLSQGPHRLRFGERPFRTWCAYDAIGIPAALALDAEIETTCGVCGRSLTVSIRDGQPDRAGSEVVWLAAGGADLRSSFCTPTVLLCGRAHGLEWADRYANQGELVTLDEAGRRGADDWAGCAAAVTRLGSVEFVDGPWAGRTSQRVSLPAEIPAPGGRYRRSVRCAEDDALRYVWHLDRAQG